VGVAGCVLAMGCGGEVVNLGSSELQAAGASAGGSQQHVWGLQTEPVLPEQSQLLVANPTLTASLDELFFSAQQRGGAPLPNVTGIKRVTRSDAGWSAASDVMLGDLQMPDVASPAVAASGTEMWLGLNTRGHTDIYHTEGQGDVWSTPEAVAELNSDYDDVPRPPTTVGGLSIMPMSSKRHGAMPALYQIYLATRASATASWSDPSKDLLASVDSDEFQSADGFLDATGLELYFSSTRAGDHLDSDLYVARRSSVDAAFGEPEPLSDLNDPVAGLRSEERMPWLSPDGAKLYFVSDHSGQYALYLATRL
jgi:hypothetical protein